MNSLTRSGMSTGKITRIGLTFTSVSTSVDYSVVFASRPWSYLVTRSDFLFFDLHLSVTDFPSFVHRKFQINGGRFAIFGFFRFMGFSEFCIFYTGMCDLCLCF